MGHIPFGVNTVPSRTGALTVEPASAGTIPSSNGKAIAQPIPRTNARRGILFLKSIVDIFGPRSGKVQYDLSNNQCKAATLVLGVRAADILI